MRSTSTPPTSPRARQGAQPLPLARLTDNLAAGKAQVADYTMTQFAVGSGAMKDSLLCLAVFCRGLDADVIHTACTQTADMVAFSRASYLIVIVPTGQDTVWQGPGFLDHDPQAAPRTLRGGKRSRGDKIETQATCQTRDVTWVDVETVLGATTERWAEHRTNHTSSLYYLKLNLYGAGPRIREMPKREGIVKTRSPWAAVATLSLVEGDAFEADGDYCRLL